MLTVRTVHVTMHVLPRSHTVRRSCVQLDLPQHPSQRPEQSARPPACSLSRGRLVVGRRFPAPSLPDPVRLAVLGQDLRGMLDLVPLDECPWRAQPYHGAVPRRVEPVIMIAGHIGVRPGLG